MRCAATRLGHGPDARASRVTTASVLLARGIRLRFESKEFLMCRNIKPLQNFDPPATKEEIRDASLQFVRKLSGATKPSRANEAAFDDAVERIAEATQQLLDSLVTTAPPRNREVEAAKAKARNAQRFGVERACTRRSSPAGSSSPCCCSAASRCCESRRWFRCGCCVDRASPGWLPCRRSSPQRSSRYQ